jgi:hypothetical protein
MKSTAIHRENRWTPERTLNPYISEALDRKRRASDYEAEMKLIGAEFRRRRIEKGYALDGVARLFRMPKSRLYKIECGNYPYVDLSYLYVLAALYETSLAEILSVIPNTNFENLIH